MADPTFQRRSILFLISASVIVGLIILIPLVEGFLTPYILSQFGLTVGSDGLVRIHDGTNASMMVQTSYGLITNLLHVFKIIIWMALVIVVVRFVGYLIFTTALRSTGQSEIGSLLRTVLSIIIYIVAFFIIFQSQYPGVQLAPLFTGSTIIGIVVGLALQDTLGNLFAGIALQADQPFQVGDVISINNRGTGMVEAVSWRGVKIRTFQNRLLIISNAALGREAIEVASHEDVNARLVAFNTLYSDSPSKTAQAVREAVRFVDNVSNKIRPVVRISKFAESGIDWEVKYWLDDYRRYNDTDALIRQRIWYVFKREGINFAFPTRTVYIDKKPAEPETEAAINETAEHLSTVPIFAPLSAEEIDRLAHASVKRIFAPSETIVRKGQEGRSMFVVLRGNVSVQLPEPNGPRVINKLSVNDFFGEMSLLTGQPRSATVVAEDEVEVIEIRKNALKQLFDSNPDLVDAVCEVIEHRKELLKLPEVAESVEEASKDGVIASIRKFFKVKNHPH